ncbi:MAG: DUF21 domain-containing protein [Deltaproteobacteria bacterium]|nr:DUF21 domain-containing protein [Deltaproteobacteria bacterium]
MGIFISSVAITLVISFVCSISEATVLSLTPGEVAKLNQRHPRFGKIWTQFKASIDRPIVVILVLNTLAHTIGAFIAGTQFDALYSGQGVIAFSIIFSFTILIFTEILPKTIGVEYRVRLALILALPLNFLAKLMHPLIIMARWISLPFTRKNKQKSMALDELRSLAAYARLSKEIGAYQEKIIQEASKLSQKNAEQIMIPASEIIYFESEKSMEELIIRAHLDPHTRFPICNEGDINQIVGYINFKELLFLAKNNPSNPSLEGIIRPVRFISPEIELHKLLRIFIEEHIHIAIVKDNEGKTLGLVTLEDIIEEFLGDIEDEFDRLPKMVHALSGGVWMVGGGVSWKRLSKTLHFPVDNFNGNLSEWLIKNSQEPLKTGDKITHHRLDFVIRRIRRGKVFEVTILPHGKTPPPYLPYRTVD